MQQHIHVDDPRAHRSPRASRVCAAGHVAGDDPVCSLRCVYGDPCCNISACVLPAGSRKPEERVSSGRHASRFLAHRRKLARWVTTLLFRRRVYHTSSVGTNSFFRAMTKMTESRLRAFNRTPAKTAQHRLSRYGGGEKEVLVTLDNNRNMTQNRRRNGTKNVRRK